MVTGGTNTAVMKYVGEALEGYKNPRIGIATWGKITQNECLINTEGHIKQYTVRSSFLESGAYLDHNHTHFLLVDSGLAKLGGEVEWRSDFERQIINKKMIGNKYLYFYFTCLSYDIIFLTFHNGPFILVLHFPTYHDKITLALLIPGLLGPHQNRVWADFSVVFFRYYIYKNCYNISVSMSLSSSTSELVVSTNFIVRTSRKKIFETEMLNLEVVCKQFKY